ncbi:T9SS type B sorting domain-containing protein [Chryseobacterium polytrichastri]|uniref:Gliding motility-associated C-terminal domain-containing protein n=1 Tax=Chryseobacterium polytrichastri TaxID=1302687 RepID=A0A1M7KM28_9FLAO|nr:T9SS type B sorting domain-containing protein [Chryseobacterium polytrichastri]SHM66480.1 gliding motility-associated C-terminal domain-containing protein [Chryseobacterium polytrichastri]
MIKKLLFSFLFVFHLSIFAQEDCVSAITVCGNSNINYTPSGVGNTYESLGGCLSTGEHNSVWYKFTIATSGTLTFNLVPTGPVDYDWAIYGPNVSCSNRGNPIRCNASGALTSTGMNMTNTNTTSAGGPTDPYCKYLDVVAGQTYYLYLDNWSTTVYTFNLTWGGTASFVSPFTNSTIAPNPFSAPGSPGPNANSPREISICSNSSTFNFSTLSAGILNSNPNFTVSYFNNVNDATTGNNPITTPITINTTDTYYYNISYHDPNNPTSVINSCKQTNAIVFKNKSLTANINATATTLCPNGNITLTSSNTTGNTWSTGATTQSITITTPGTYTLISNNGICTSPQTSIVITQDSDPNVQITGNLVLCESPTQLVASANGTGNIYTWSTGSTGNTISVSTPGTYMVTVKTPANCLYQKSIIVTQGIVPTVQNSSLSQCSDSTTATFNLTSAQPSISTTSSINFDYYINQADALAGNTNTISNPTTYASGNATLYVRIKSTTCSKIAELQLIVNQKPVPTITASSNLICTGNSITLTSSFAIGNIWSTGQNTQSIIVNSAGTYTLTNNNGNCTSDPVSIAIAQSINPNVQITGNLTPCDGTPTTLTATANGIGNTFLWSNGANTPTNTVTTSGIYTVTVTTPTGCQYQKSVTVAMNPAIIVNIATPSQITCSNSQSTLDATTSVYQSGSTFLWTTTGGGSITSGANTLTPTLNNAGTYTLTITGPSPSLCTKQASVTVIKNTTSPTLFINAPKLTICKGESIVLTASGAITYTWTGLTGNGNTQTVSPTTTTTYTVTGVGANGCAAQAPISITIKVVPEIVSTLHDVEMCKGDKAFLDAGAGPNYTYSWNTGATTQTITTELAGIYSVTISNGVCSKIFNATVAYTVTPEILEVIYKDNTLTINVKNNGNLPLEYSIDGGVTWQFSNVFTNVLKNTQYSINVKSSDALCYSEAKYYTFFMSNVITPNNDGKNDVIDFSEISKYGNFEGSIFDRYGKAVFNASTKTPIWNGRYIDRPLPTGTYWYKLFWTDKISKKPVQLSGWILLKNRD